MRKSKALALVALAVSTVALSGCWPFPSADSDKVAWQVSSDSGATATGTSTGTTLTGTTSTSAQGLTAYVAEAAGTVSKKPAGGRARPVTAGVTTLVAGDTLSTGQDGSASVTFTDGTTVRLAPSTRLVFSAIGSDAADATLQSGSIWARVLKPLGDGTLYTFRTADLSAGVRGTAVFLTTDATGSLVEVHDSYAEKSDDAGAIIGIGSGSTERRLPPRHRLFVDRRTSPPAASGSTAPVGATGATATGVTATGTINPPPTFREEAFDKSAALSDDFKRVSTQKDLVLMSRLIKERDLPQPQLRKVEGELALSMPSDAREALALVKEHRLFTGTIPGSGDTAATAAVTVSGGAAPSLDDAAGKIAKDSPAMLDRIERDLTIGELRDRFNRDAQQTVPGGSNARDEQIVANRRALDGAVERLLDPTTKQEDLRREIPGALPPLPGEGPRPQDDGTLQGLLQGQPQDGGKPNHEKVPPPERKPVNLPLPPKENIDKPLPPDRPSTPPEKKPLDQPVPVKPEPLKKPVEPPVKPLKPVIPNPSSSEAQPISGEPREKPDAFPPAGAAFPNILPR